MPETDHAGPPALNLSRIVIVGTSGSGKSTLARSLADTLGQPCIEMDDLRWLPRWTLRDNAEFTELLNTHAARDRWVIDGNLRSRYAPLWTRITLVVWLDYPLRVIMPRLLRRTARRLFRRESLWSGNRETVLRTFGPDSILLWALKTHRMNRRIYEDFAADPPNPATTFLRLRRPDQADRLLGQAAAFARSQNTGEPKPGFPPPDFV